VPASSSQEDLIARVARLEAERDEYKKLYLATLEICKKLEQGIIGPKRERYVSDAQSTLFGLLNLLVPGLGEAAKSEGRTTIPEHTRSKPTGRKPPPESLPRVTFEVLPPEVQKAGLDAFERIGEDTSETIERRPGSLVVVKVVRPKFVSKAEAETKTEQAPQVSPPVEVKAAAPESAASVSPTQGSSVVLQAPALELPIPRALAGPGMLADTIVRRFEDHLPLYRLESIYRRDGLALSRSTICDWHMATADLVAPLIEAMWADARANSPYLCTDATGVLVQAKGKCRRGHFFVVVAPGKHVLFKYSPKHNSATVKDFLAGFQGMLVADAHSVYEEVYGTGQVLECGCWAHVRRYFFKALLTDDARARRGLELIQALFRLERDYEKKEKLSTDERLQRRKREAAPVVDAFFTFAEETAFTALDETPISKAVNYALNQRVALTRFLEDGRLPIHNNISENALRREAVGRKNWLFLGNDDGGETNASLVTLLASCKMHGIEPLGYWRDLLCLLPGWVKSQVLELAPANWKKTIERPEVRAQLEANVFRQYPSVEDRSPAGWARALHRGAWNVSRDING
jgi:transposase